MKREEFANLIKAMKAVYADPTFIPDGYAMDVWYGLLQDLPYEVASAAVQKHMATSTKVPKPADIREAAAEIRAPETHFLSEAEAWDLVYRAIGRSSYYAEEEFVKLPPLCQKAVGSPANLKELASMNTETVQSVEKSLFQRDYRAQLERVRKKEQMPEGLSVSIDKLRLTQAKELAERMIASRGEDVS